MSFTIPSYLTAIEDPTGVWPQAEVDPVDWDIWGRGLSGGGVVSGCQVTQSSPTGMKVNVASGRVVVNGVPIDVSAQSNVVIAAAGAQPRFDLVSISSGGTATITQGSGAVSSPAFPALLAGNAPLAAVYIPANLTNVLNAHIVDKRITVPVPGTPAFTKVSKGLDESRQSTTTVADDAVLTVPVSASAKYDFRFVVWINSGSLADFKFGITAPASPTNYGFSYQFWVSGGATTTNQYTVGTTNTLLTDGTNNILKIDGFLNNGANAGAVTLQWAQGASQATNTTVYAGSYIEWDQI